MRAPSHSSSDLVATSAPSSEEAIVEALLPQRLFRLKTKDDVIIAGLAPIFQQTGASLLVGQRVLIQRMRLDPGRGLVVGWAP